MLEAPELPERLLLDHLWVVFGLHASQLAFLPLGADVNTAVYRVETGAEEYFFKLRKGDFNEISVALPQFLHEAGIAAVISPLQARSGDMWGELGDYRTILYPFVAGEDGYRQDLRPQQWLGFGKALRAVHDIQLPAELSDRIPGETLSPRWREQVRAFQEQVVSTKFVDPVAAQLAAFIRNQRETISRLVDTAENLVASLRGRAQDWVLCHADIHPGNLHLPPGDPDRFYLVDWDNPVYALRERDLALIGGTYAWRDRENVAQFYQGYQAAGQVEIDPAALRYYRCERVVVDMAEFCQQILMSTEGEEDRKQALQYFTGAFRPGHEVDLALGGETRS